MDLLNRSSRRMRRRREQGMAFVETLFVLPILLLLIFALADFGFLFKNWIASHHAAKTAVRFASLHRSPCNAASVQNDAETMVDQVLDANGVTGPLVNFDLTHEFTSPDVCSEGLLVARVQVESPFTYLNILLPLGFPPVTTTAVATALNENTGS